MSLETISSDKQSSTPQKEGDEAIISASVAGEVVDASIVEVGRSRPQYQYTRKELMTMKDLPLSKRKPDYLDSLCCKSIASSHVKLNDTPPKEEKPARGEPSSTDNQAVKRRTGDPRDRIRKEQDSIVLSPQRRSFNSGCFVNVDQLSNRSPESPLRKPEIGHREPPIRRIGSGRILTRDLWDFQNGLKKVELERIDFVFGPSSSTIGGPLRDREQRDNNREPKDRERNRIDRNDRYIDRPGFFGSRDYWDRERDRDRPMAIQDRGDRSNSHNHPMDRDRMRDRKYVNDRRRTSSDHRDDEPEWFSSGPTSQHDTIELRGFEDITEEKEKPNDNGNSVSKNKKSVPGKKKKIKTTTKEDKNVNENSTGPKGRSTPTILDKPIEAPTTSHSPISGKPNVSLDPKTSSEDSDRVNDTSVDTATDDNTTSNASTFVESSSGGDIGSSSNSNKNNSTNVESSQLSSFHLDEFLKSDTFLEFHELISNGIGKNDGSCSRSSRWFKRESPNQELDSQRVSIQDELLNNLLNDITEPKIKIPSVTESNTYFAPISPATTTTTNNSNASTNGVKLLEMLQRGNKPNQNGQGDATSGIVPMMKKDMELPGGKVHSLEELEARMRGKAPPPPVNVTDVPRVNKTEEDMSAFKKLLAQVNGGQAVPAANGSIPQKSQPLTLMQILSSHLKTPQQQQPMPSQSTVVEPMQNQSNFNNQGQLGHNQHPQPTHMHENLLKVLQIQQQQQQQQQQKQRHQHEMLSMMMGNQQSRTLGISPVPTEMQMMLNNAPSSQELLQRPEAQAIIQGLQQGEITCQHLMQQLQNPAMQHRHREVLVNILKFYGGNNRTMSPHPNAPYDPLLSQVVYQQPPPQQQRIPSPMSNMMPHRVPSPRELAMHTQHIIQNALIKKKLEEQHENFRKRQEQQRAGSPANSSAKQTMSPTPLAFTPTSVLRKMTADKEPDGNNDTSKIGNQNTGVHLQQMQSAVQLLNQNAVARHNAMRSQQNPPTLWANPPMKQQHPGRPIVKGGGVGGNQFAQPRYDNMEYQQQQSQQAHRTVANMYGNPARSKHTMTTPLPHPNIPQYNVNQRTAAMNNQMKVPHAQPNLANIQHQQQQKNLQTQLGLNQNYNSTRTVDGPALRPQPMNVAVNRHPSSNFGFLGNNGEEMSSTSNQLARWFSPELLAQARAGKLPELGQTNVLSLEELERHQHASTTVHN